MNLTATTSNGQEAQRIAQTYASTFVKLRRDEQLSGYKATSDQISAGLEELRKQLSALEAPIVELNNRLNATVDAATRARLSDQRDQLVRTTQPQRASLQASYSDLENKLNDVKIASNLLGGGGGIQTISNPEVPTSPGGIGLFRAIVAALGLGVLLALVVAFLREALDSGAAAPPSRHRSIVILTPAMPGSRKPGPAPTPGDATTANIGPGVPLAKPRIDRLAPRERSIAGRQIGPVRLFDRPFVRHEQPEQQTYAHPLVEVPSRSCGEQPEGREYRHHPHPEA